MGKDKNVKSLPPGREGAEECSGQLFMDSFTQRQLSWFLCDKQKIFQLFILIRCGIKARFPVLPNFPRSKI